MNYKILLIIILISGLFLRVVDINNNPPSLYGDELTIILDANSILKTGHDQLGNFLPLTFPMGAGRPAGYVYFSIPFIVVFGPTALGVRMLSVLSGVGIIFLLYLLGKKIFSQKLGLIAAFFASISPWDISLSRGGFEAHFALFLAILGVYCFIKAKEKPQLFIASALFFGLTIHTYPTYKLTLPIFLPVLYWFQYGFKNPFKLSEKKYILGAFLIGLTFVVLAIFQSRYRGSETRFSEINIFSQKDLREKIIQKINFERSINNLPTNISKYFLNKPLEYVKVFGENYLQNFSVDFLFLHGDKNPRHNMSSLGQLYLVDSLLVLFGLITLQEKRVYIFLLSWIIGAPLATAFVSDPSALRSVFMLPPLIFLSSLGLNRLLNGGGIKRILLILFCFVLLLQFIYFAQKLYFLSPNEYSRFWSYPAKSASDIAIQNKDKYDFVILSDKIDNMEFAYPVYVKVDPKDVISQNKKRFKLREYSFKKFGNVYIGSIPNSNVETFIENISGSALYIGDPTMVDYLEKYETIINKDGLTGLVLRKKV